MADSNLPAKTVVTLHDMDADTMAFVNDTVARLLEDEKQKMMKADPVKYLTMKAAHAEEACDHFQLLLDNAEEETKQQKAKFKSAQGDRDVEIRKLERKVKQLEGHVKHQTEVIKQKDACMKSQDKKQGDDKARMNDLITLQHKVSQQKREIKKLKAANEKLTDDVNRGLVFSNYHIAKMYAAPGTEIDTSEKNEGMFQCLFFTYQIKL